MPIVNFASSSSNGANPDGTENNDLKNQKDNAINGNFNILSDPREFFGKFMSLFSSSKAINVIEENYEGLLQSTDINNINNVNNINSGNTTNINSNNTNITNQPTYNISNTKIINKITNIFETDYKIYQNKSTDYKFYNLGKDRYAINTDNGYDEITGVKNIIFGDKSVNVQSDIKETFDQVTGLNTDSGEMFRLYNASFARFPDADGLKYWINKFSSGEDTKRVVAQSFLGSEEFTQKYGSNVSNETYVNNLYKNVLGRDADIGGLNYWVGNLSNGIEERHEALLGFSESAENKVLFSEMTGLY